MSEVRELDLRDGNEVVLDIFEGSSSHDEALEPSNVEGNVGSDVELANPAPPSLRFLSDDEDALLGMEEGHPILGFEDSDGVIEVREDEFGESFGDEEEMEGGGDGSGRGGRDVESVEGEGEVENSLESFDGEGRERGGHAERGEMYRSGCCDRGWKREEGR